MTLVMMLPRCSLGNWLACLFLLTAFLRLTELEDFTKWNTCRVAAMGESHFLTFLSKPKWYTGDHRQCKINIQCCTITNNGSQGSGRGPAIRYLHCDYRIIRDRMKSNSIMDVFSTRIWNTFSSGHPIRMKGNQSKKFISRKGSIIYTSVLRN